MSAISAPADRRFRRAHVKPARRRRTVLRAVAPLVRHLVLGALVVYAAYRGAGVVTHAHVLQVDRIVVHGNERLSKGEVLGALNGLRGENLVWTDLDQWRQKLLATPWVRDALLRRSLPSTVDVTITERQPVGIGRVRGGLYLVDETGVIIDQYGPQYADLDLPIIDGLATAPGGNGTADAARADLAARAIGALAASPEVAKRLSQVDVADAHDATVILAGDPALIRLGEDQFLQRLQAYLDLSPALHERVPDIDYVDLRFDDRIYVRPAGKAKAGGAVAVARKAAAAPPSRRRR